MDEIAATEACGKPIEIWFCDEARVGQKNKITRRWARPGTRPSAPSDQRTQSAYIFGATCPAEGKAAGLVLPRCTSCPSDCANGRIGSDQRDSVLGPPFWAGGHSTCSARLTIAFA